MTILSTHIFAAVALAANIFVFLMILSMEGDIKSLRFKNDNFNNHLRRCQNYMKVIFYVIVIGIISHIALFKSESFTIEVYPKEDQPSVYET
jgi:hypothetical protein